MEEYPAFYKDITVKYKGIYYWGYYTGNDIWRVGTSEDGRKDDYVLTEELEDWKPLEYLVKLRMGEI